MQQTKFFRYRPKQGTGFYLEMFDNHSFCFEGHFSFDGLPVIRIQLPGLLVEFGLMDRAQSDALDKFFDSGEG